MSRFSAFQKEISGCVKDLILLYDRLRQEKDWYSEPIMALLKQILRKVGCEKVQARTLLPGEKEPDALPKFEFEFDPETKQFCFGQYRINIDESQLKSFLDLMEGLRGASMQGVVFHFLIPTIRDEVVTDITPAQTPGFVEPSMSLGEREDEGGPERSSSSPESDIVKVDIQVPRAVIDRAAMTAIRNQKEVRMTPSDVSIRSVNYRIMDVQSVSEFGTSLLLTEPQEDPRYSIPSINFSSWSSFVQIVRAILVNFHFAFGNFERIKTCSYCRRLIFAKNVKKKSFCSPKCKTNFNRESESRENRLCRERQNAWLRYKVVRLSKRFHAGRVTKSDCEGCGLCPKSGECQVLKKLNKEAFRMMKTSAPLRLHH